MINRRQILQSFFGFTAGCAVVHCQTAIGQTAIGQTAIGGLSALASQPDNSSRTLIERLQNTIQLCDDGRHLGIAADQREAVETRELCQQAIARVQRSTRDTTAFWQACSDSVSRMEAAVSAHIKATAAETQSLSNTLHELHSLRKQLEVQAIQAIGTPGRLV